MTLRFTPTAAQLMRQAIQQAGGVEIFVIGDVNDKKEVCSIDVHCRGNENSVPALMSRSKPGQVVIHNHPSGLLQASHADMHLANLYGENGIGVVIVNNNVDADFWVVEPHIDTSIPLDPQLIRDFFEKTLPRVMPNFEARPGQIDMALHVTEAFNKNEIALLEAGTGTGKSLAYLVPATFWSLQNNSKVAIATFTITLQSQLVNDDIPILQRAGLNFQYALMKGRSNYICRRRFEDQLKRNKEDATYQLLKDYIENTQDGTRSDLPFPVENDLWEYIQSDSEQTMRAKCPHFEKCFYYQDRRKAARSNLLIINHHLLLADLLVKSESGNEGILPKFDRLVLDEGHHLEDSATSLLRNHLTSRSIRHAIAPLISTKKRAGALEGAETFYFGLNSLVNAVNKNEFYEVKDEVELVCNHIQQHSNDWFSQIHDHSLPDLESSKRLKHHDTLTSLWNDALMPQLDEAQKHLNHLSNRLIRLEDLISEVPEVLLEQNPQPAMDVTRVRRRLLGHFGFLKDFVNIQPDESNEQTVRWIERTMLQGKGGEKSKSAKLCLAPVEVAPLIRDQLLMKIPSMVSCSATMTVNNSFEHYQKQVGIVEPHPFRMRTDILPTPFDYQKQAILALPTDLPNPKSKDYIAQIAPFILQTIYIAGGGVFVLCTSYKALDQLYRYCQPILGHRFALFRQGEMGRNQLLQTFIKTPKSVLFAADSFWEGVSVPGQDLRMIVIPSLPFRVPSEPIQQARHEKIVKEGGNPFQEYSLPQAALKLRQGFGRLIRTQQDFGSVVILDNRLTKMRYGKYFLDSLPNLPRIQSNAKETLRQLDQFHNPHKYQISTD